jgi:hypothetical protein
MHPQTEHARDLYRSRTTRISPPVAIDLYDSVLRIIDQLASCTDFAIPASSPASSGSRLRRRSLRMPHETVRHHVEEMPRPVGDFLELEEPRFVGCWPATRGGSPADPGRVPAEAVGFGAGQPKGRSSRMLRRNRRDIASRYRDGGLWPPAHFRCVGRRRSDHQAVCGPIEAARLILALKDEAFAQLKI